MSQRMKQPTRRTAPIIDQEGREVPVETLGQRPFVQGSFKGSFKGSFTQGTPGQDSVHFKTFTFNSGTNPFANLTREQRLARLDALAKLLDVAFIVPGTNVRYGIDGLIGLIPVIGDIITTAISLWLVREARALGAPWHLTMRMLGNVALDGAVGIVPLVGDAFDVMFRANVRNVKMLQRWLEKQPRL
ncbi:MAG: hypothetical protein QOD09_2196 [Bradyrhizobium sp.]|nr:hypothetical protein [Bradyrhizobium sp.]